MRWLFIIPALLSVAAVDVRAEDTYGWQDLFPAIRVVESGATPGQGIGAVGDHGKAIGPYQIWMIYHLDAAQRDATLQDYRKCLNDAVYSEKVIKAYMGRYASKESRRLDSKQATLKDLEKVARIHNGGPRGHMKTATKKYWAKVLQQLKIKSGK